MGALLKFQKTKFLEYAKDNIVKILSSSECRKYLKAYA